MHQLLKISVRQIEDAYARLGFQLGWRFLYTPAQTMSCTNGLMLVGVNPGGDEFEEPAHSVESGNAYLVESWSQDGRQLQNQLRDFFGVLSKLLFEGKISSTQLFNETLTANFCPFRSPTWKTLPKRKEAIEFSNLLWKEIFDHNSPRLIFCMGREPFHYFSKLISHKASKVVAPTRYDTGWGKVRFHIQPFHSPMGGTTLIRIPHFSRFKLMSRAECGPHVEKFVERLRGFVS